MGSRGRFITFEGPEGGGKTTHVRTLADRLEQAGRKVVCTREPGSTALGESIRAILCDRQPAEPLALEAEVFLFAASRAQLVQRVILPALAAGNCVVSDRFVDSTTVYQGYARGIGVARMEALNELAMDGAVPDVTVLLDLDVEVGFARIAARYRESGAHHDRIESEDRSFHERVRAGYLELADRWPDRVKRVDADRPAAEVDEEIWSIVQDVLER